MEKSCGFLLCRASCPDPLHCLMLVKYYLKSTGWLPLNACFQLDFVGSRLPKTQINMYAELLVLISISKVFRVLLAPYFTSALDKLNNIIKRPWSHKPEGCKNNCKMKAGLG